MNKKLAEKLLDSWKKEAAYYQGITDDPLYEGVEHLAAERCRDICKRHIRSLKRISKTKVTP